MTDYWELEMKLNPLVPDALEDPDTDVLVNLGEFLANTDPLDSDTDEDAMPDGWEVFYGLNPLVNDAGMDFDNDTLTNLQEYYLDFDPNEVNNVTQTIEDGEECPPSTNTTINETDNSQFPADSENPIDSKNIGGYSNLTLTATLSVGVIYIFTRKKRFT